MRQQRSRRTARRPEHIERVARRTEQPSPQLAAHRVAEFVRQCDAIERTGEVYRPHADPTAPAAVLTVDDLRALAQYLARRASPVDAFPFSPDPRIAAVQDSIAASALAATRAMTKARVLVKADGRVLIDFQLNPVPDGGPVLRDVCAEPDDDGRLELATAGGGPLHGTAFGLAWTALTRLTGCSVSRIEVDPADALCTGNAAAPGAGAPTFQR